MAEKNKKSSDTSLDYKLYEGFPYISYIEPVLRNKLTKRQYTLNRLNTKTPWVKFTSGIKRTSKPNEDSNFTSLVPLISKGKMPHDYEFSELYDPNSGFRPIPGITDVSVKYLSKYGGVREATISWTISSLEQFEMYSTYFFTPGIAMLLEWGWTNDYNTYQMPNSEYINFKENIHESWVYIHNRSLAANCEYDAMHGIIKNFSFALNPNGGFDCTTTIISGGSLMYGLNLTDQANRKIEKDEENAKEIYDKNIKGFVKDKLDDYIALHYKDDFKNSWLSTATSAVGKFIKHVFRPSSIIEDEIEEEIQKIEIKRDQKWTRQNDVKIYNDENEGGDEANVYVTWGFIEEVIVNRNLQAVIDESGESSNKLLYKLSSMEETTGNIGEEATSIKISNNKYLRTTDLKVCVLPQGNKEGDKKLKDLQFAPIRKDGSVNTSEMSDFAHGEIRNIFVHIDVVKDAFESSEFLTDALLKILNKINSACGNMWNFSIKIKESNSTMVVIDENYTDTKIEEILKNDGIDNLYKFSTFGGNSIIKEINFDASLPNSMAMTSMYGHHASDKDDSKNGILNAKNNTITSLFNEFEFEDHLYPKIKMSTEVEPTPDSSKKDDPKTLEDVSLRSAASDHDFSETLRNFLPEDSWLVTEDGVLKDQNITHENAMKNKMLQQNEEDSQFNDMIVPGDLTIKLEGLAGFRIGDIFLIDALPDAYLKYTLFQISGIDHSISNSTWETTITAKLRVINTQLTPNKIRSHKNKISNTYSIENAIKEVKEPSIKVLKWIKDKMGPVIKTHAGGDFTEDIIAGIIHTETGGSIASTFDNGKAQPHDIVKKSNFIGDQGHAFGFYQIHTNTAEDWIKRDKKSKGTWSSPAESTRKVIEILNNKKQYLSSRLDGKTFNILEATISAYNRGEGTVAKNIENGKNPDDGNRNNYVAKVFKAAEKYRNLA